jgi:hypothetical protein
LFQLSEGREKEIRIGERVDPGAAHPQATQKLQAGLSFEADVMDDPVAARALITVS